MSDEWPEISDMEVAVDTDLGVALAIKEFVGDNISINDGRLVVDGYVFADDHEVYLWLCQVLNEYDSDVNCHEGLISTIAALKTLAGRRIYKPEDIA